MHIFILYYCILLLLYYIIQLNSKYQYFSSKYISIGYRQSLAIQIKNKTSSIYVWPESDMVQGGWPIKATNRYQYKERAYRASSVVVEAIRIKCIQLVHVCLLTPHHTTTCTFAHPQIYPLVLFTFYIAKFWSRLARRSPGYREMLKTNIIIIPMRPPQSVLAQPRITGLSPPPWPTQTPSRHMMTGVFGPSRKRDAFNLCVSSDLRSGILWY